jgi:hypothetical protein
MSKITTRPASTTVQRISRSRRAAPPSGHLSATLAREIQSVMTATGLHIREQELQ